MSTCIDRCRRQLPEYIHGLLGPEEEKWIEGHLEDCPECAMEARVLGQFEKEVLPEPPQWYWATLPGKVTAQVRRKRRMRVLLPMWAGGAVAAAAVLLMFLLPHRSPQPQGTIADYSLLGTSGTLALGLDEDISLPVSGAFVKDLDQILERDLGSVPELLTADMEIFPEGDGYESMDRSTIKVFEELVEEMTPKEVGKKVIS